MVGVSDEHLVNKMPEDPSKVYVNGILKTGCAALKHLRYVCIICVKSDCGIFKSEVMLCRVEVECVKLFPVEITLREYWMKRTEMIILVCMKSVQWLVCWVLEWGLYCLISCC